MIQVEVQMVIQMEVQLGIRAQVQVGVQVQVQVQVQARIQARVQVQVQDQVAQVPAEWVDDAFGRYGLQDHGDSCMFCHSVDTSAALFALNKSNNGFVTME